MVTVAELSPRWERVVPGFPANRTERIDLPPTVDGVYLVEPDAFELLLKMAGFKPIDVVLGSRQGNPYSEIPNRAGSTL